MYNARFEADNGKVFRFGENNVFDINVGDGISVNLNTSQGFANVGEVLEGQSVKGRTLNITGVLYGDIPKEKKNIKR